jgi:hypothetical protein
MVTKQTQKLCSVCGWRKPLDAFHKDASSPDGHAYTCKYCAKQRARAYYVAHRDEILELRRLRYWLDSEFRLRKRHYSLMRHRGKNAENKV